VHFLFERPVVTIPEVQQFLGITYPAAQGNIVKLVKAGILEQWGDASYGKTYVAREVLRIASAESAA
jgi:predicted HTH transcriptional regulator